MFKYIKTFRWIAKNQIICISLQIITIPINISKTHSVLVLDKDFGNDFVGDRSGDTDEVGEATNKTAVDDDADDNAPFVDDTHNW